MESPPPNPDAAAARHARQKRTVTILGVVLIIGGAVVMFGLRRMPLPARMLAGMTDVIAGMVLLLAVRQKL